MAVAFVRAHTGGQNKNSLSQTIDGVLSATVPAGNTLVLGAAMDNFAGSSGTLPNVTGISVPAGETATWVKLGNFDAATVSTGGTSVRGELWAITTTQSWLTTDTVTVTISVTRTAKAVAISEFSGASVTVRGTVQAANDLVSAPTATTTDPVAGDLVVGMSGWETATLPTGDSDTTNGSWGSINAVGTTGSGDTTNIVAALQHKIVTATGSQTYNPTNAVSNDAGVVLAVLQPAVGVGGAPALSGSGTLSSTGTPGLVVSQGLSGSGTLAVATPIAGTGALSGQGYLGGVNVPSVMAPFLTALANRNSARVNIGMLGASLVEGYPVTPDKTIAQYLAEKFRTGYSVTGNPKGYGYMGMPSSAMLGSLSPWTITPGTGGTVGTATAGNGWGGKHQTWLTGTAAVPPILVLDVTALDNLGSWTSFDLNIIRVATYSATGGRYRIDGGSWVNFSIQAASGVEVYKMHVASAVTSTLEVSIDPTASGSFMIVNGVTGYSGDESIGIQVHDFGHAGFRVNQWLVSPNPTYDYRYDQFNEDLDLLILQDLGVNDAQFYGASAYRADLITFINYLRAVHTTVPMVMVSVQDLSSSVGYVDAWADYVAVNKSIASLYNMKYIDYAGSIPTPPNSIYYTDNIHGATDGSMYSLMADTLYAALAPSDVTGTAGLSGSGTLTAAVVPKPIQTSGLSGSGSLTTAGAPKPIQTLGLSGIGTLSTAGLPTFVKAVGFSGAGSLSSIGSPAAARTINFTGSGTLSMTGVPVFPIALGLAGSGTLSAGGGSPNVVVAAGLTGSGTLSTTQVSSFSGALSLSGAGTLAPSGSPMTSGTTSLSGSGTLSLAGTLSASGSASFSGSGTLLAKRVYTVVATALAGSSSGTGWTNPGNATGASDSTYASWTSSTPSDVSAPLTVNNFGTWSSIASTAPITKIKVRVKGYVSVL